MEAADYEVLSVREQLFHERVRECIISALLFATLYILCHIFLTRFKKPAEFTTVDDEDATVNKIALELCTFTLAVALGAVLLLPFSIISNEVLLSLPRNYYIQWLNGSLIHGLWNLVFLFSNLSLIFLMPFAYFFTESEGFAGSRKGVLGRVYETVVMLLLLTLLVLGMVWVASAIVDNKASRESLYDFWEYYLPYLYSCISFLGVLLLLVCTPLGLARMFSVTGKLLVKPRLLEDLEEQLYCSAFEEAALTHRICNPTSCWLPLDMELLHRQVLALQTQRVLLEKRRKASAWQRNLGYPLAMLCLLVLTGLSVLIVAFHILELLIDEAAMPRGMQDASLGQVSFSKLGSFGAIIQVVLIFYLMVSSVVGFYSSPLFRGLRPRCHDTAMTQAWTDCRCLFPASPGHLGRASTTSDLRLGEGGRELDTAICYRRAWREPGLVGSQGPASESVGGQRGTEPSALLHNLSQRLGPGLCFSRLNSGLSLGLGWVTGPGLLVPNPFTNQSASLLFRAMPGAMFT
uniref:Limb development membrane protein 1 like n=1 Tax=Oryctolagus cuniculus TaxID=9986 RepID=A0A5F9DG72_RABIT